MPYPTPPPEPRAALKSSRGFAALLLHLFSEDLDTLSYALAVIQNTCREPNYLDQLQEAEERDTHT